MSAAPDEIVRSLSTRLRLSRPLVFLDLETTGVSVENDRIVEIALVKIAPDGAVSRYQTLVNPGQPIPPSSTAVHKITDADVREAPRFGAIAPEVARFISGCDFGGFNVAKFDLKLLATELERAGHDARACAGRVVCAMAIFHRNERRDLAAAVKLYVGKEHEGHRASVDVDATIEVLAAQLERYGLPATIDELADYCDGRQPDWLSSDGRIAWRDGAARITFGKHAGKSLQTMVAEEPGYLRWMLDKDFPDDLKTILREALAGRLPQRAGAAVEAPAFRLELT